jgi:glycosyltransferase involved in cell wall biosynthesis
VRILLTSHRFWPSVGGTEEVVEQLARHHAQAGHDVTVFTSDEPGTPEREEREGYLIRRFPLQRRGKFRFPPKSYREAVLAPGWDVVHLHGQRVWSTDYLYRHLRRSAAPIVFTAHGFYQWHVERAPLADDLYYRVVMPRALRHVAAAVALTRGEAEELRTFGVAPGKVRVIPDGFVPDAFSKLPHGFRARHGIAPAAPLLLYVGGFYRNKRVDRAIEVAADTGATLAIVGRDAHREHGLAECKALAERTGADARFLGVLPRDDLRSAYAEADLLLLPSDFEGFGLVLLEAMAAGLPFVATPVGAAPDLAALGAGVVAGPGALSLKARELLADPPLRKAMGEKGKAAVGAYTWPPIAERYQRLYEEVARK